MLALIIVAAGVHMGMLVRARRVALLDGVLLASAIFVLSVEKLVFVGTAVPIRKLLSFASYFVGFALVLLILWWGHVQQEHALRMSFLRRHALQASWMAERVKERELMALTFHELRNPLNGTVGHLRLAKLQLDAMSDAMLDAASSQESGSLPSTPAGPDPGPCSGGISTNRSQLSDDIEASLLCTNQALHFLETLSTIHRTESGVMKPTPRPFGLHSVVHAAATIVRPQVHDGVALHVDIEQVPDGTWVYTMLLQILTNLLQNAARFTTAGVVLLRCESSATPSSSPRRTSETGRSTTTSPAHSRRTSERTSTSRQSRSSRSSRLSERRSSEVAQAARVSEAAACNKEEGAAAPPPLRPPRLKTIASDEALELSRRSDNNPLASAAAHGRSASPVGSLTQKGRREHDDKDVTLTFTVADTGCGLDANVKATLFDRYKSVGGVGLGMFLTKQLVQEVLGSRLRVESPWADDGSPGTRFSFVLKMPQARGQQGSFSGGCSGGFGGAGGGGGAGCGGSGGGAGGGGSGAGGAGAGVGGSGGLSSRGGKARMITSQLSMQLLHLAGNPDGTGVQPSTKVLPGSIAGGQGSPATPPADSSPCGSNCGSGRDSPVQLRAGDSQQQVVAVHTACGSGAAAEALPALPALPPNVTVLVADDVRINRQLLGRALMHCGAGWTVTHVETGEEALERALATPFELIIIDEVFSQDTSLLRGSDVVRRVREHEAALLRQASPPGPAPASLQPAAIISCTGNLSAHSEETEHARLLSCGADQLWGKPFPSFTDGAMQRCLAELLASHRRPFSCA